MAGAGDAAADAASGDAADAASGDAADGGGVGCVTPAAPAATKVTRPGDFVAIFDAIPDATGATIYFTAVDATGRAGVFSVPAGAAPAAATAVSAGAPFIAPIGVGLSSDGTQLYVADPATDEGGDLGAVYVVSTGGGAPTAISKDTEPRGLAVLPAGGGDAIFFTGRDPSDGQPGVFQVGPPGGPASPVAKGPPFADPSGMAIAVNGDVFVADTIAAPNRGQSLLRIRGTSVTVVATGMTGGYPAGVALACGDTGVWVSLVAGPPAQDTITSYDPGTMAATMSANSGLGGLFAAGGLHRAAGAGIFAFVDSAGDGTDAVYVVK
jgi:DNA-binding beta-propeller fold protein YncE